MNPPRIWLDYRPVRIGWVVEAGNVGHLTTAANCSTCLWGGRFNPIIPFQDHDLADNLIRSFRVDVLVAVERSDAAKAFIDAYPHLHLTMWAGVFGNRECAFVDIRHAVRLATGQPGIRGTIEPTAFVRPVWSDDDPMSALFSVIFGRYPAPDEITINYVEGIRSTFAMPDHPIDADKEIPVELSNMLCPLGLTGYELSWRRGRSGWLDPGIVLGDATSFYDLLLFWNLQAAGAQLCFFDRARGDRCKPFVDAFVAAARAQTGDGGRRFNFWGRGLVPPWNPASADLDLSGLQPFVCGGEREALWNGMNARPRTPQFSAWHRDVVVSYSCQLQRNRWRSGRVFRPS
jgi:hypothetical protein